MVDKTLLAAKIAAVRDAADRVRTTLPVDRGAFLADRTVREVVRDAEGVTPFTGAAPRPSPAHRE